MLFKIEMGFHYIVVWETWLHEQLKMVNEQIKLVLPSFVCSFSPLIREYQVSHTLFFKFFSLNYMPHMH